MADVSLFAGDIGTSITFAILSAHPTLSSTPYSSMSGSVITWHTDDGGKRTLSVVSAGSGTVRYVTSSLDFTDPVTLRGQICVSATGKRFFTNFFDISINENLQ